MKATNGFAKLSVSIVLTASLAACGGGGGDDTASIVPDTGSPNPPVSGNRAPTISGAAPDAAQVGQAYSFTPSASDPDGDTLTFSIQGRPSWASFNSSTGQVSGTPQQGDANSSATMTISVSDGSLSASLAPFTVQVSGSSGNPPPVPTNQAPTISGSPPSEIIAGQSFTFTPTATDPNGDTLTFSIQNRPSWVSFNTTNGQISGTPQSGDIGSYNNIVITVSDGQLSDSMTPFTVSVVQTGNGSVTLSWTPPTQNTDGTPLTDLAGYAFYYGTASGNYSSRIEVSDPSLSTYVIDNLTPNTYYFAAVAIKQNGVESGFSNEAVEQVL